MLDYETLDSIADLYVPLLAVISIVSLVKIAASTRWRLLYINIGIMVFGLSVAYGLMFLDAQFLLWPIFGLDYSTHTAVSLVMVIFLIISTKKFSFLWVGSLVSYVFLMLYQGYHSSADILTTALVVGLFLLPMILLILRGDWVKEYVS